MKLLRLFLILLLFQFTRNNAQVGIETTTPSSKLDINGDLSLREGTAISVASGTNAITLSAPEYSHYRLIGATGAFTINTIIGGNNGQILNLINATSQAMTINNNDVANGILTGNGASIISSGTLNSSVTLIYNATLARWIVSASSGMINSNSWNVFGNAGSIPATNFIGTTDNIDLVTRTNNIERMRLTGAGNFGINTSTPSLTDRFNIVSGSTMNGMLINSSQTSAGSYGLRNSVAFSSGAANVYTGYNGSIQITNGTASNAGIFSDIANGTAPAIVGSTNGTNTSAAIIGTSTVWNGINARTSNGSANAIVGLNTSGSGVNSGHGVFGQTSQLGGCGIYGLNNAIGGISFGWAYGDSRCSILGDGTPIGSYSFGVIGDSAGISPRSGGVFGDNGGFSRGVLGYYTSASVNTAVYGFGVAYAAGAGAGRAANSTTNNEPNDMIGLGIYGGVLGGWIRGLHYGLHAKGYEYGMYVDGNTITNKPIIQLIDTESNKRNLTFSSSSMSADIVCRGIVKLSNGNAYISFNENFTQSVSDQVPLNITVTPTGETNGLYVTDVTNKGFRIVENRNGNANVNVNWVAYGIRTGYENTDNLVSAEILSNEFDSNMDAVMYNDHNKDGKQKGIWFDGTKVKTGQIPNSFAKAKATQKRVHPIPSSEANATASKK